MGNETEQSTNLRKATLIIGILVFIDLIIKIIIRNFGQSLDIEIFPWLYLTYRINDIIPNTPRLTSFAVYLFVSIQAIVAIVLYVKGKYSWKMIPVLVAVFLIEEIGLSFLLAPAEFNVLINKKMFVVSSQAINTVIIALLVFAIKSKTQKFAMAVICSGAIGNLLGYFYNPFFPIDYLKIRNNGIDNGFRILNVADMYITIGIIFLILSFLYSIIKYIVHNINNRKAKKET